MVVGYPESSSDAIQNWPSSPEYYNSAIVVNRDGEIVGSYRKKHLFSIDETWALEGKEGFYAGEIAGVRSALGISSDIA